MEYADAKQRFIQAWGTLGQSWGINKAMAQIHALLLISTEPLSTEDIMEELSISRGNANMNVRALIDWGIVDKTHIPGERKEYFTSEKDLWALSRQVIVERKKRELEPLQKVLAEVQAIEGAGPEVEEFKNVTGDVGRFANRASAVLEQITRSDKHWFFGPVLKLFGAQK